MDVIFTQFHSPEEYLLVIELISKKFLECDSDNSNSVAKFNFGTLQDALLYVFYLFNDIVYKVGGPTIY